MTSLLAGYEGHSAKQYIADAEHQVRLGFIRKVYSILSAQIIVTAVVAAPFVLYPHQIEKALGSFANVFFGLVLLFNIITIVSLTCCGCKENSRIYPRNMIILFGFTFTEGILVGFICSLYSAESVILALALTSVLVLSLSIYAVYTKSDFTDFGVFGFIALLGLMCLGSFFVFIPGLKGVYCAVGISVFSFYLVYDTQRIMGDRKIELQIDDYVAAALMIYIDIVQLFLYILQLIGDRN